MNILPHSRWILVALVALPLIAPAQAPAPAPATTAAPQSQGAGSTFKQEELDAMLAPIALYPDSLLAQMLMASTYPLEIVQAARWRKENATLKGDALQKALEGQTWDASVKSLTEFPDVLDRMNKDLSWTQKLGDAFLGQQAQVMETVQMLRKKASDSGNLKSNEQQKVEVQTVETKQYIVIEPANPQVVYVPVYQPTVVYGGWWWPTYPPYYPPYWVAPGAAFVNGFFWGAGIAAGAALWGNCNWRGGDVNINVNRYNNFNKTNINNANWSHNVNNRGAVPYRDNASREKYASHDRQAAQSREQFRGREAGAGGAGGAQRGDLAANRQAGGAQTRDFSGGGGGAQTRDFGGAGGGGATRDHSISSGGAAQRTSGGGAFQGGNGAQTRAASSRGNSSMGAARGGGGGGRAGGGGGRGGGGRR